MNFAKIQFCLKNLFAYISVPTTKNEGFEKAQGVVLLDALN